MVRCVLKLGLIALAVSLAGCNTTQLLKAPGGSQSAYAPVNEATRPGLIRYVWSGDKDTDQARRLDAYERMWHACDGKYRILDEEARTEPTGVLSTPNGNGHVATITYWYIEFECVKD